MREELQMQALFAQPETSVAYAYIASFPFPWQALESLGEYTVSLGKQLPREEYAEVEESIWIAGDARIAPTAFLRGPCIICHGAEVRHGAFLRGNAIVGRDAVVGNSTELKNCILFDGVQVPHYNYVGDSILGYRAHMGAGAITSNVKSDKSLVRIAFGDARVESGRKKLGAILGDLAEIGCNSVLNPGTVIGRESTVYPLCSVRGFVPPRHIYKREGEMVKKRTERA